MSGGRCERCNDFIPFLPKEVSNGVTSSKWPASTLDKGNYWCPVQMQALVFQMSKIRGDNIHASRPRGEAGSCSPFKSTFICTYGREFQVPPLWTRYSFLSPFC